jgi:hypothetical protein
LGAFGAGVELDALGSEEPLVARRESSVAQAERAGRIRKAANAAFPRSSVVEALNIVLSLRVRHRIRPVC